MTLSPPDASPLAQQIYRALEKYLKRDPGSLTPNHSFREDLGLDSLMTIELLYEIETAFDLQIPDADISKLVTIGDIITYIEARQQPGPPSSPAKPKSPRLASQQSTGKRSAQKPPARKRRS